MYASTGAAHYAKTPRFAALPRLRPTFARLVAALLPRLVALSAAAAAVAVPGGKSTPSKQVAAALKRTQTATRSALVGILFSTLSSFCTLAGGLVLIVRVLHLIC